MRITRRTCDLDGWRLRTLYSKLIRPVGKQPRACSAIRCLLHGAVAIRSEEQKAPARGCTRQLKSWSDRSHCVAQTAGRFPSNFHVSGGHFAWAPKCMRTNDRRWKSIRGWFVGDLWQLRLDNRNRSQSDIAKTSRESAANAHRNRSASGCRLSRWKRV